MSKQAKQNKTTQMSKSTVVSLEPLAPIIVGSGRPFGQAVAEPSRFPPPSTVAGCLRTAWGRTKGQSWKQLAPQLAQISVAGPLLLTRNNQVLVPKPADALYFGHGDSARCVRVQPHPFNASCGADLPDDLLPVQLTQPAKGKPGDGPAWWSLDDLLAFRQGCNVTHARLRKNGWKLPQGDRRTHVAIDSDTGAADAGKLFQTEGLDLDVPHNASGSSAGGLRLLVRFEKDLGADTGSSRRRAPHGGVAARTAENMAYSAEGLAEPNPRKRRPLSNAANAGDFLGWISAGLA